ncbi:MAG: stage II sporulation protein R [Clostridiales bacterium]|nr:stage II sporulation protein R [Clostridiales bacterium]
MKTNLRYKDGLRPFVLLMIIILSASAAKAVQIMAQNNEKIQEGIAAEIIRFHVIANSDSPKDQELKYQVKDTILDMLTPLLSDVDNISESRTILINQLPAIEETAVNYIRSCGFDYSVKVTLEPAYFPMKVYGEFVFPPGTYEALRVQIGSASGKNWWCVMFPPLCLVDETYSIVGEDSKKNLKNLLSEEEYDALLQKAPVKYKFKLLELIKNLFSFDCKNN